MTAAKFDPTDHPHKRLNVLTGEWVLVSPHRAKRPWQGQNESKDDTPLPSYDPDCFLCAGNKRISGDINPNYKGTFVFENDFAALQKDIPDSPEPVDPLFQLKSEKGEAHVICFSPDHSKTLPELDIPALEAVVQTWADQYRRLSSKYEWVQLFENKGAIMGCSQPHPHGQVWANSSVPTLPAKEHDQQSQYYREHGKALLLDYALKESKDGTRTIVENEHWIAVVPYWASWPFETLLLPKFACRHFHELNADRKTSLAKAIKELTIRYDNLFETSFPYSMGWHGAPTSEIKNAAWQLHAHFFPPLLRSATVKKFMVGYEMMAESQRDLTPEQAAEKLQQVSNKHYKEGKQ
ncbi:UDP-glucose--hexose-1-phosphate uridylyltransferase [Reinekea marinisedimentorum]|uniref:Galactose-1-phosphate uridylyltransferase n=1 Tax=Reinekea marinisedimentorum TaxID=230495 RepID=A0A4R3IAA7_9GAMM|nr:UDP-glucose--hexose-1-phosphate uridylyltransferase [Reinekea marinisedimentorum]TCS42094.1 UDPglucose--hexose-1-phosphate uridylyltransferase [Reinekea marinisedimentorum]